MGFLENVVKFMNLSDDEYFDEYDKYSEKIQNDYLTNDSIKDDEEMILRKIILGEMLTVEDVRLLVEITLNEFKKTFGNVNDDMEIIFRKKKEKKEITEEDLLPKKSNKKKGDKDNGR